MSTQDMTVDGMISNKNPCLFLLPVIHVTSVDMYMYIYIVWLSLPTGTNYRSRDGILPGSS
jgi:hypothetical protein